MVYRIHFETKGSYWCIQFRKLLSWKTAMLPTDVSATGKAMAFTPMTFETYDAACEYVSSHGIETAYNKRTAKTAYNPISSGMRDYPVPLGYRLVQDVRFGNGEVLQNG